MGGEEKATPVAAVARGLRPVTLQRTVRRRREPGGAGLRCSLAPLSPRTTVLLSQGVGARSWPQRTARNDYFSLWRLQCSCGRKSQIRCSEDGPALIRSTRVSLVEPQANPETVEVLLEITWRVVGSETARTESLDRKASAVATFASLVAALNATLGLRFVEQFERSWALAIFVVGLSALVISVVLAIGALFPREYRSLGIAYLKRFPTWSEIRKAPPQVRGEAMASLIEAVAQERESNDHKAAWTRWSFVLLLAGLVLIALEAATLAARTVIA